MLTKIIIENNPYMFVKELEKAIKAGYNVVYEDGREPTINGWTLSAMLIKDEVVEKHNRQTLSALRKQLKQAMTQYMRKDESLQLMGGHSQLC